MARLREVAMRLGVFFLFESSSKQGALCVERLKVLLKPRLSEMKWYNHYFTLAQARWVGLSKADGLAWA
ncbi:hypothetical protein DEO72_LG4g181 [Vigna unguiculata]|uniref:Uncharacterized protein n=1 Tax=Vigna unguiculata TaxID=3917 RepID=A0A4D6LKI7_VIGUN|nr:hypothetical protein DEO72_LG4g181 [Vigna unguiculata]